MNIMCRNSNCKNYFEDRCELNRDNKMIVIDESGLCGSFEKGVNEAYSNESTEESLE